MAEGAAGGFVTRAFESMLKECSNRKHNDLQSAIQDDGLGGRRNKGLKEKITEKLPGRHSKEECPPGVAQPGYGGAACEEGGVEIEKKGMIGKIKEKLPGGHRN